MACARIRGAWLNRLILEQGQLVLPTRVVTGDVVVEDGVIAEIAPRVAPVPGERRIDAHGCVVLPGAIDSQAHFRHYTRLGGEDLHTGSLAAAVGGVTTVLEMPDAHPSDAHSVATLRHKLDRAAQHCVVHYGLWLRATRDNLDELLTAKRAMGVRIALDCSPDQLGWVQRLFASYPGVIAVHAEDRGRLAQRYAMYDEDDVTLHPKIRDVATAVEGTELALNLAGRHGSRVHLLHVSSAEEIERIAAHALPRVTAAVAIPHLVFDATALAEEGTRVQGNPPLRNPRHREALWKGLASGAIGMVSSDHCPHHLADKERPYPQSASGMPGIEWMLPLLADAAIAGRCTWLDVARWTSGNPASAFGLRRKGRIEVGFDADLVVVDPQDRRELTDASTRSACGWCPYRGRTLTGFPRTTLVLGHPVFHDGQLDPAHRGRELAPT